MFASYVMRCDRVFFVEAQMRACEILILWLLIVLMKRVRRQGIHTQEERCLK